MTKGNCQAKQSINYFLTPVETWERKERICIASTTVFSMHGVKTLYLTAESLLGFFFKVFSPLGWLIYNHIIPDFIRFWSEDKIYFVKLTCLCKQGKLFFSVSKTNKWPFAILTLTKNPSRSPHIKTAS